MAFLYSSYIILYAILNPLLGKYIDQVYNSNQTIRPAFIYTVGVQITIISVIVALSTFIPKNSFQLNPSVLIILLIYCSTSLYLIIKYCIERELPKIIYQIDK